MIALLRKRLSEQMAASNLTQLASIELTDSPNSESPLVIHVMAIWSTEVRFQGNGSRALAVLTACADELDVTLELEPHYLLYDTENDECCPETDHLDTLNESYLENNELRAWYARHGFVV